MTTEVVHEKPSVPDPVWQPSDMYEQHSYFIGPEMPQSLMLPSCPVTPATHCSGTVAQGWGPGDGLGKGDGDGEGSRSGEPGHRKLAVSGVPYALLIM